MNRKKAFSLFSGGLDSLLASRLIMDQGIEVIGLHFITPFFGYYQKGREAYFEDRWRRLYGVQARIIDIGEEYLDIVRNPRYGFGKNLNPCIDCKIFLFTRAKKIMEEENADFLVTGEVLGQRPMSQRRDTLRIVERDSGTDGILLRPLSAKNLKPTRPELEGIVDRERLLNLSGRSRKPQINLAKEMGWREYPTPAGGCLLTDPLVANRIRKYFARCSQALLNEILLLQVGRHFELSPGLHLVVGRRDEENKRLQGLCQPKDFLFRVKGIPGPLGLLRGEADQKIIGLAAAIVSRYGKAKDCDRVEVHYGTDADHLDQSIKVSPAREEEVAPLRF